MDEDENICPNLVACVGQEYNTVELEKIFDFTKAYFFVCWDSSTVTVYNKSCTTECYETTEFYVSVASRYFSPLLQVLPWLSFCLSTVWTSSESVNNFFYPFKFCSPPTPSTMKTYWEVWMKVHDFERHEQGLVLVQDFEMPYLKIDKLQMFEMLALWI